MITLWPLGKPGGLLQCEGSVMDIILALDIIEARVEQAQCAESQDAALKILKEIWDLADLTLSSTYANH